MKILVEKIHSLQYQIELINLLIFLLLLSIVKTKECKELWLNLLKDRRAQKYK